MFYAQCVIFKCSSYLRQCKDKKKWHTMKLFMLYNNIIVIGVPSYTELLRCFGPRIDLAGRL